MDSGCPAIADKPDAIAHVDYTGVEHKTYCYGPMTITPGQNIINLRPAVDAMGNKLWPQEDGYITRFDPEFIYADGSVPRVDVLHLHHAVWLVNGRPAVRRRGGEDDPAAASGFRLAESSGRPIRRVHQSQPCDSWLLNDMLHNLLEHTGPGLPRLAGGLRSVDLA